MDLPFTYVGYTSVSGTTKMGTVKGGWKGLCIAIRSIRKVKKKQLPTLHLIDYQ